MFERVAFHTDDRRNRARNALWCGKGDDGPCRSLRARVEDGFADAAASVHVDRHMQEAAMHPTIDDASFFEGVTHDAIVVAGNRLASAFYYRVGGFDAVFTVRSSWARELLSGTPLRPIRVTAGRALLTVSGLHYEDSDVGPYSELLVGLPVRVAGRDGFANPLRWFEHGGGLFVWQVGVTTDIARDLGVEILGWPKFVADISVDHGADPVSVRVSVDGRIVLAAFARRPACHRVDERDRFDLFARRGSRLLRCQSMVHVLERGVRLRATEVRLTLGDHTIAEQLRVAGIGKRAALSVTPHSEMILTGSLESWHLPE